MRQRAIVESLDDPLKNIQQIEHTRHRRVSNAMVNVLAAFGSLHAPFDRHGHLHEEHFYELAGDLPVEVGFVVTQDEADRFLATGHRRRPLRGHGGALNCVQTRIGMTQPTRWLNRTVTGAGI